MNREVYMKKTKILSVLLVFAMAASLTACNTEPAAGSSSSATETSQSETTVAETTEEVTTTETEETTVTSEETTATTEATAASSDETAESSETSAVETRVKPEDKEGKRYADLDDMHFYINGKKYTLGKTTLREMIDDGVPFRDGDMEYAESIVKPDHLSQPIRIALAEDWSAQISTINNSEDEKKAEELVISKIELSNRADQEQDVLSFEFPLYLTMKDLVDVEGVPKDEKGSLEGYTDLDTNIVHATFTYRKAAVEYVGDSSYIFVFANNDCEKITIEYRP